MNRSQPGTLLALPFQCKVYGNEADRAPKNEPEVQLGTDPPIGRLLGRERHDGQKHVGDVVQGGPKREEDGTCGGLIFEVARSPCADDQVSRAAGERSAGCPRPRCHSRACKVEEPARHVGLVRRGPDEQDDLGDRIDSLLSSAEALKTRREQHPQNDPTGCTTASR